MPRVRNSGSYIKKVIPIQLTVISILKSLSEEADRCIDEFPTEVSVDAWFNAVKESFIHISDCTSIKDIATEYPPDNSSIFGQERSKKIIKSDVPETQIEHIHVDKNLSASKNDVDNKTETDAKPEILNSSSKHKVKIVSDHKNEMSQNLSQTLIISTKKVTPKTPCLPCTPKIKRLMLLKNNVLQSGTFDSNEKCCHTPTNTANKVLDRTIILNSDHSSKKSKLCKPIHVVSSSGVKTRSSIKRKSSVSKEESNKKQKINGNIPATSSASATKSLHPKCAVEKSVYPKASAAENKMKVPAIIPTTKFKMTPVQSKEKILLEEIKKKEEKIIENRKKVLAERQMKAEENKKKREEKIEKTKQNRLKIEKEKEKLVIETIKSQTTKDIAKKNGMKTRIQELIDQNAKENKSGPSAPSKQNETPVNSFKTPASKMSDADEKFVNYELTPIPDSSTYNFSDEEDNVPAKPIPSWAQCYYLKSALLTQYYNPPDTDEIFGRVIDPPDLTEIFQIQKKRYKIRTSSAIWNTPPDRCLRY